MYGLAIIAGIAIAWLVRRCQPADPPMVAAHRGELLAAAAVGAVLGAYLGDLPSGWLGWDGLGMEGHRLGGRTVLGGLIGGWLGVEAVKRLLAIRMPTGDGFAAPLAAALACGRIGCLSAGCCGPTWVTLTEIGFHAAACGILLALAWRRASTGRCLAAYLTIYAALRFTLEFWRGHPPIAFGVTWYQGLAVVLFILAGTTWLVRTFTLPAAAPPPRAKDAPPGCR